MGGEGGREEVKVSDIRMASKGSGGEEVEG